MLSPKIIDLSGGVHAVEPHEDGSEAVRTLCRQDVTFPTYDTEGKLLTCVYCGVAICRAEEEAYPLNKAISFGRQEAGFDLRVLRRGGSPSPYGKTPMHEVADLHERAGKLLQRAVADELPIETVIRAAYRVEMLRLELLGLGSSRRRP